MNTKEVALKRGDCILTESPFAYALKSKYRQTRCDHCLKDGKVLKCSSCQYVYYCSRQCQAEAWSWHKIECDCLRRILPKLVPDAARILARIILKLNNGGDMEKSHYTDKCYRKFRDMMSHYAEIKSDLKRLEHIESLTVVLAGLLGRNLIPNPNELLGIYGRLTTNGFNILDPEMNSIATGIYLGVSVTDHSCKPNAVATFEGVKLQIRLTEDMPSLDWSKIYISYVDLLNTPEQRRHDLRENYYFLCICTKCLDPREPIEMEAAACLNRKCNAFLDIYLEKCPQCQTKITTEHRQAYKDVMEMTKEHLEQMKDIAYLDICKICLNRQKNIFHPLNLWHVKTLDMAFESAIDVNKWAEALEFGPQLIPGFRKYYGEWNPLLGLLYMKLGKIQLYTELNREAFENLTKAHKIIEVTHGTDSSLYKEQLIPLILQASAESESQ